MNTWLPEKRSKYNDKRRKKDLDFVYSNWNLPNDMMNSTIHISEVPAKVAKKYKRAVAIHGNDWYLKNEEYCAKVGVLESRGDKEDAANHCFRHATSTLAQMHKVLPTYESKTIIDIPANFRKFSSDILGREISGVKGSAIGYLFWNSYRLAVYYNGDKGRGYDDELCLRYANEALSLLPQLQEGELPHHDELRVRTMRALSYLCMKDYKAALLEYRVCLAAVRLLDHSGRLDMSNPNDSLVSKVNMWPHTMIRMSIKLKIQNGASRPFFTKDEQLDLMKEHAYGIYSPSCQKCMNCGNTEKLSLCSGCKGAWFCDKNCATKAWKAGHKEQCGPKKYSGDILGKVQTVVPFAMPASFLQDVHVELDNKLPVLGNDSMGLSMLNLGDRNFLALCKDPRSGEIFDVFTDEAFELLAGHTMTRGSKFGHAKHFHCIPSGSRSQE